MNSKDKLIKFFASEGIPCMKADVMMPFGNIPKGYTHATSMCSKAGRKFSMWYRRDRAKLFVQTLMASTGKTFEELVMDDCQNKNRMGKNIWVCPEIAMDIYQWADQEKASSMYRALMADIE